MFALRPTKWTFNTSAGLNVSGGEGPMAQGAYGHLVLNSPSGGRIRFNYASLGVGVGAGPLPVSITASTEDFPSNGAVLATNSANGVELHARDFCGVAIIQDASLSGIASATETCMYLGARGPAELVDYVAHSKTLMHPGKLVVSVVDSAFDFAVRNSTPQRIVRNSINRLSDVSINDLLSIGADGAKAMVVLGGMSVGKSFGVGITGSLGYVWLDDPSLTEDGDVDIDHHAPYQVKLEPVRIDRSQDGEIIALPADVLFRFNRHYIRHRAIPVLHQAGRLIKTRPNYVMEVRGYTCTIGKLHHNMWLSQARATTVMKWLVSHNYVDASRIVATGHGPADPVADNSTLDGRKRNRRVEIFVTRKA
jgi:outer membrane protein OmpA-like peptidoglycan-associated protein